MEKMEISSDEMKISQEVRKGGIRTMPFIVANEAFEKVASTGLHANMILYLTKEYHLNSATGANVLFLWGAISNFMPTLGAFLSDSYLGRFRVIALGTVVTLIGIIVLWLTALFPEARPPHCHPGAANCVQPNGSQLALLFASFAIMSVGAGGIRPCSLAFGADQFDNPENPKNERILQSFFNFYYASVGISLMISVTVIVYIQMEAGWIVGFGVPAGLMFLSTVLFLVGSSLYVKVKANKSLITGFAQVVVVAFKNKHLAFPPKNSDGWYHYSKGSKLVSPTEKIRFLNKACIIRNPEKDLNTGDSASEPWHLCTVQQVEALKALIKVVPIWSTGIIVAVTISQNSFPVLQANTMDRRLVGNFKIPAGSFGVFALLTLTVWVGIYDRIVVPWISKFTKRSGGLSLKQRMGIGLFISCFATAVAALVERARRGKAIHEGLADNSTAVVDMSAMWLVPQHCLTGLAEAFNAIGQINFYYSQFPKSMSSIGVALFALGMAVGNLVGSLIVGIVDGLSKRGGGPSWVSNNLNQGHYDYYYWVLTILSVANFFYFIFCSRAYGSCEEPKVWDEGEAMKEEDPRAYEESPLRNIAKSKESPLIHAV
ncbi:hypothetical protein RJ639_001506 [Escallonia herrerae]|uniref:Nitrate transporter n=1 Tax=Escallonia herrerae TaxID=1293975 RepID=A0AA88X8T4_9ASTE|nr:hypothetical protein RJ639_001506 [Escallonia herrerae]